MIAQTSMTPLTPENVMGLVVRALDAKKAQDLKVLYTRDQTVVADYFVIATASSVTHAKTLSDELERRMKENGEPPLRIEGYRSGGWALIDFGCVIAHIFLKDLRAFYNLERLWSDAAEIDISGMLTEAAENAI